MVAAEPLLQKMTPADYLVFERSHEMRHEFVDGEIIARTGANHAHNLICTNIVGHYGNSLVAQGFLIFQSMMRLYNPKCNSYRYPDIVIVCDKPKFQDKEFDSLLNPTVLIEVLSPSSISEDRVIKAWEYRQIDSLQDYLIIASNEAQIEHYQRQEGEKWLIRNIVGLDAQLEIIALSLTLNFAKIYEAIEFEEGIEQVL